VSQQIQTRVAGKFSARQAMALNTEILAQTTDTYKERTGGEDLKKSGVKRKKEGG